MNYHCLVSGKVQGVFYRSSIQQMASDAGYSGYVKNLPNGDVEVEVTTDEQHSLEQFLEILKTGSSYSRVDNIITRKSSTRHTHGFNIAYD